MTSQRHASMCSFCQGSRWINLDNVRPALEGCLSLFFLGKLCFSPDISAFQMTDDYYQSIENLSRGVQDGFTADYANTTSLCMNTADYADTTLLCMNGLNVRPRYSLWSLDIDEINVTNLIFNSQSCLVEEYEFQSMFVSILILHILVLINTQIPVI